ncbi:protein spaetzle 5-like [Periplaneta americana]|uniref:protein spaetzle 5-like n=1 Tax=Periplaneta americana TaxID=6978 RepID=UPI0037E773BC
MMPGLIAVYLLFGAVLLAGTTQESSSWHKLFSRLRKRGYIHLDDASRLRRIGTSFIPNINEIDPNATFIEDVEGYPHELLLEILKKEGAIHNDIFGVESEFEEHRIARRNSHRETPLCPSITKRVFPKAALSKDGQWKYVVNTKEDYIQGVDVEICGHFETCSLSSSFPSGYTTKCQQKYAYRKLLSLGKKRKTMMDDFKMPSCCACLVEGPHHR